MNDEDNWENALSKTVEWYKKLEPSLKKEIELLTRQIRVAKNELMLVVLSLNAADICCNCGGLCCRFGKYHPTTLDLLALFGADSPVPTPDFGKHPLCPYSEANGCCSMSPEFRPTTCIIFNCELLEQRLSTNDFKKLIENEKQIRELTDKAEKLVSFRLNRPALLSNL